MYGKDNRILCSAKLSQDFKVVSAKPTRQGAGVPGGGSKIGVKGCETHAGNMRTTTFDASMTFQTLLTALMSGCGMPGHRGSSGSNLGRTAI
jgi:hypothetical protein